MLELSEAVAFLPSEDLDRSRQFFSELLGLPVLSYSPFACVFRCGNTTLRVTKVESLRPQPFTVFGWTVGDIRATVAQLQAVGVNVIRFEGMDQDPQGVWSTPNRDLVAWFHDPDRNTLSVTQFVAE